MHVEIRRTSFLVRILEESGKNVKCHHTANHLSDTVGSAYCSVPITMQSNTYLSLSFSLLFVSFSFSSTLGGLFLIKNLFSGTGGISSGRTVESD